jgi:hypothetical protein
MSGSDPTDRKSKRQAERLALLHSVESQTSSSNSSTGDDGEAPQKGEPLAHGRAYTPATLRQAMGIGRSYYNTLIGLGLPKKRIGGRIWFSGTRVIEWIERHPDDGN